MPKRKILFLGETYRADAITWMNGLKEFGDFEIITWELKSSNHTFISRCLRLLEFSTGYFQVKKTIKLQQPDMVIAERTTSYGFLAAILNFKPIAIAQQGRTDLWPSTSFLLPLKKITQNYAFQKADLIHAWGPVMAISMKKVDVDMSKVMVLPKGIDLEKFGDQNTSSEKISAIVTRSLMPEYSHDIIYKPFGS
jgi:Glycosyl transferase 4-like